MSRIGTLVACISLIIGQLSAQLAPFPSWATGPWDALEPTLRMWAAPVLATQDQILFHPLMTHSRKVGYGSYTFGFRSIEPTIAVWHHASPAGPPGQHGGLPTGLAELYFIGMSKPGPLFPGYSRVLMWTGRTASGLDAIGALPIVEGYPPDPSLMLTTLVSNPSGGVWAAASMIGNGIAVIDGQNATICWIEYGLTLHPGIAVNFPRRLREPITAIELSSTGQVMLGGWSGKSRRRLVIDIASNSVIDAADNYPTRKFETVGPLDLRGGMGQLQIGIAASLGTRTLQVQRGPTEAGPWQSVGGPLVESSVAQLVEIALPTPLVAGEFVRIIDAQGIEAYEPMIVSMRAPVIFRTLPLPQQSVSRGGILYVIGQNLVDAGATPAFRWSPDGPLTLVSATPEEIQLSVPANYPLGDGVFSVITPHGEIAVTFKVQ